MGIFNEFVDDEDVRLIGVEVCPYSGFMLAKPGKAALHRFFSHSCLRLVARVWTQRSMLQP